MKLRIAMIAVTVLVAAGAGLYFYLRQDPVEVVVYEVLEGRSAKTDNIEIKAFVDWYKPMVSDASKEVFDIMRRFDAEYRSNGAYRNRELEDFYPADEWIQRLLDMGAKIESYDDYSDYLEARWHIYHASNDPEDLQRWKKRHGLDADASFEDVVDAKIKKYMMLKQFVDQAMANDPKVHGGEIDADGVFIPYRYKTVYLQKGSITAGDGVPRWVVHELSRRESGIKPSRQIPSDIDVFYLNEKGQPRDEEVSKSWEDGHTPAFRSNEADTVGEAARDESLFADDFDNSFTDDLPPSDAESYEFEKPNLPQSVADLEKQFTPEGIEEELSARLSPERFDKAQELIDQYGTEEGLRRLRESDPDAARRFDRERLRSESPRFSEPSRDASDGEQSER